MDNLEKVLMNIQFRYNDNKKLLNKVYKDYRGWVEDKWAIPKTKELRQIILDVIKDKPNEKY